MKQHLVKQQCWLRPLEKWLFIQKASDPPTLCTKHTVHSLRIWRWWWGNKGTSQSDDGEIKVRAISFEWKSQAKWQISSWKSSFSTLFFILYLEIWARGYWNTPGFWNHKQLQIFTVREERNLAAWQKRQNTYEVSRVLLAFDQGKTQV